MHNNRLLIVCTVFLCLMLCLPGSGTLSYLCGSDMDMKQDATYIIRWATLNEGGKTLEATSTSYKLKDAIGQPVIGECESANFKAHIGFWAPIPLWVVGVEEMQEARGKSLETRLFQNYPNPFHQITVISYQLSDNGKRTTENQHVMLKIYDLTGRLVKTFDLTNNQSSFNQVVWDGKDDTGKEVTSGIYFCRLQVANYTSMKKMILLH